MAKSWLRRFRALAARRQSGHSAANQPPELERLEQRTLLSAVMLDPSFGDGGVSRLPLLETDWEFPHDLLQQPDGKIIALGDIGDALRLARYHLDGLLDETFGDGGRVAFDLGTTQLNGHNNPVGVVDSDGGIILAVSGFDSYDYQQYLLLRLNADGSFDDQFGTDGVVRFGVSNRRLVVSAIGLDSARHIVVSATEDLGNRVSEVILTRFQSDGTLDPTFGGGDGWLRQDLAYIERFEDLEVQADGDILLAGSVIQQSVPGSYLTIVRYTSDGQLDANFGVNGIIQTYSRNIADGFDIDIHDIEVDASGRLLVAGERYSHLFVARYLTSGALDTTFNGVGWRDVEYGSTTWGWHSVKLDSQGRILATGQNGTLVRLLPNGALDNTFSFDGRVSSSGDPFGLVIDDFDRPIVLTDAKDNFNLLRYTQKGELDATFGGDGTVVTEFLKRKAEEPYGAYFQDDGKIIVVGEASARENFYGTIGVLAARYNPDGSFDETFGGGDGWMQMVFGNGDRARATHVVTDDQGRIVIGGVFDFTAYGHVMLIRLMPDGTVDTSFGTDGVVVHRFTQESWVRGLSLDSAGQIILAAGYRTWSSQDGDAIFRFDQAGALDPTWGNAGSVLLTEDIGFDGISGIMLDDVDRVVFSSYFQGDAVVGRLTTTGALDTSFNGTGSVRTDLGGNDYSRGVVVDSQGRIIVGAAGAPTSYYTHVALARYLPDGQLDTTYGTAGVSSNYMTGYLRPSMLRIDPLDRVIVGGDTSVNGFPTAPDILLIRFTSDGQLDTSLSLTEDGGPIAFDTVGQRDRLAGILFDADHRPTLVALSNTVENATDILVWRYLEDLPGDDRPVAIGQQHVIAESTSLTSRVGGLDVEGAPLSFSLVDEAAHGLLLLTPDGQFTYTPLPGYYGKDSFSFVASDGGQISDAARVIMNVTPVNTAPQAVDDQYMVLRDRVLNVPISVLASDVDADGDALQVMIETLPAHGTLVIADDGTFTYTPQPGFVGSDSFAYRAFDGLDSGSRGTVTIAVTNSVPTAESQQLVTDEEVAISGTLVVNDDDGDALVVGHTNPLRGTLQVASDRTFIYTPHPDFRGTDSFTYWANDGVSTSPAATVSITVTPVNDVPIAANDTLRLRQDAVLPIAPATILGNDSDIDGDLLSVVIAMAPSHGTLSSSFGNLLYTPQVGYFGPDSFTYRASDGVATSNLATVSLDVVQFAAPSSFTASVSGSSITLNWIDNGGGFTDGFYIERASKPKGNRAPQFRRVASVLSPQTSWINIGVSKGEWWYRVRAFDGSYVSPYSDVVTASVRGKLTVTKNNAFSTTSSTSLLDQQGLSITTDTTSSKKSSYDNARESMVDLLGLMKADLRLNTRR